MLQKVKSAQKNMAEIEIRKIISVLRAQLKILFKVGYFVQIQPTSLATIKIFNVKKLYDVHYGPEGTRRVS